MCIYLITITEIFKRENMMKITLLTGGNSLQFCHNAVQYWIYVSEEDRP